VFQILAEPLSPAVEAKKFLIHVVCKRFVIDRPGGSMKLLVYEIAGFFAVENWRDIMGEVIVAARF
jgi:hypothetical protein